MLAIPVMGARQIGRAERRPETVGEIGEIAAGDEGVLERLLALIGERQKRRLTQSPVWMPAVTVRFAARAAWPAGVLASAATGASPFRTAMLLAVSGAGAERRQDASGDQSEFRGAEHHRLRDSQNPSLLRLCEQFPTDRRASDVVGPGADRAEPGGAQQAAEAIAGPSGRRRLRQGRRGRAKRAGAPRARFNTSRRGFAPTLRRGTGDMIEGA